MSGVSERSGETNTSTPEPSGAAVPHATLPRRAIAARVVLALLFLLGAFFSLVPVGRAAARATLLLPALIAAAQPAPLVIAGDPVQHTRLTIPSQNGPVYLDVYAPSTPVPPVPGSREGVVIIAGVGDNRDDKQLRNLLESMARSGLVAMNMTTDSLIRYALSSGDSDAVVSAVQALQHWPGVGANRVGILGFSAGGALACLAAADPRIRDSLAFITLFGGYFDATTLLRDFGRRALEVDGTLVPWQPNIVPLQVLANTIAGTLPPDQANVLTSAFAQGAPSLTQAQLAVLSPDAAAAYHLLKGDQPESVSANIAALSPPMQQLLAALSPRSVVANIATPIYLLHDRNDEYVPYTESREFAARLAALHHPHEFVEFSIFAHVEVKTGLGLGPLIGDGISLFRVLTKLLLPAS